MSSFAPTLKPTGRPSREPTKAAHIYGQFDRIQLDSVTQQAIVAALTIALFLCMAFEFQAPEILFLIALMVVTLSQILTMSEALSGIKSSC